MFTLYFFLVMLLLVWICFSLLIVSLTRQLLNLTWSGFNCNCFVDLLICFCDVCLWLIFGDFLVFADAPFPSRSFVCLQQQHRLSLSINSTTFTVSDPMAPRCIIQKRVAIAVVRPHPLFIDGTTMPSLSLVGK